MSRRPSVPAAGGPAGPGTAGPAAEPAAEAAAAELAAAEAAIFARSPSRVVPTLERIRILMDLLGEPQRAYPAVHVTGTNGKTSTTRMVDALLRASGLRTGRFTSPHLESVTERIAVDGAPLAPAAFAAVYRELAGYAELVDARGGPTVTFHELLTAMAFAAFADAPVDVAVVEVGMGGGWDATNVLDAPVAVVTPVSLDHQQWLGATVAEIAAEKAGIVAAGSTLVAAPQPEPAAEALRRRCAAVGATAYWAGRDFAVADRRLAHGGQLLTLRGLAGEYEDVLVPLHGAHQAINAVVALAAVEAFFGGPDARLDPDLVREGFAAADSPGRLEVVRRDPTVLLDAAHNPAGAAALAAALAQEFGFDRLVGVLAVLADKDVAGILAALEPVVDTLVVTRNGSPRALAPAALGTEAERVFGRGRVRVVGGLPEAIDVAVAEALALPAGSAGRARPDAWADGGTQDAVAGGVPAGETPPGGVATPQSGTAAARRGGVGVLVTGSVVTVGEARSRLRGAAR